MVCAQYRRRSKLADQAKLWLHESIESRCNEFVMTDGPTVKLGTGSARFLNGGDPCKTRFFAAMSVPFAIGGSILSRPFGVFWINWLSSLGEGGELIYLSLL